LSSNVTSPSLVLKYVFLLAFIGSQFLLPLPFTPSFGLVHHLVLAVYIIPPARRHRKIHRHHPRRHYVFQFYRKWKARVRSDAQFLPRNACWAFFPLLSFVFVIQTFKAVGIPCVTGLRAPYGLTRLRGVGMSLCHGVILRRWLRPKIYLETPTPTPYYQFFFTLNCYYRH
jgi:hypothetical protein